MTSLVLSASAAAAAVVVDAAAQSVNQYVWYISYGHLKNIPGTYEQEPSRMSALERF